MMSEMEFVLIRHSAMEHRRVNIHRVPKVVCVFGEIVGKMGERACDCGQCHVRQGRRHDTWMTIVL